ncbi:MAG: hypothetical protein A3F91_09890 [Flavobacteria bacterium RIFCSPLOWO2_12_FULL_35_11]|nr:MAG: hypothetical protein A3F91_09890 [Flavobacteria bacterium RIFCSPLOWO2_12_FULL_35_11]
MRKILFFVLAVVFIGCSEHPPKPPIQHSVEKVAEPIAANEIFDSFNKKLKFHKEQKAEKEIYEYGYKFFNDRSK